MSEQVNDRLLELFVSQKYHWKSLSTGQQMAIAVELLRHRCVEKKLYEFIEAHAEEKDAWKQYRKLLLEERTKQS
tara:strand:- start:15 stop:239 length:225 start_codon:yes stop_codon:yes gene_type:complete